MKRYFLILFVTVLSVSCFASQKDLSQAQDNLAKILENYQMESLLIPVKQDIFVSILKTNLSSEGLLFFKGNQFRLDLKGNPSSLSLYDGSFFWHQPDLKEKLVFQVKKPSEVQNINTFFNKDLLLEKFDLVDVSSMKGISYYHFRFKKKKPGLEKLLIKTNQKWILEIRLTWEDLNTWQKYTLSKPVKKENPDALFKWVNTDHRIIETVGI